MLLSDMSFPKILLKHCKINIVFYSRWLLIKYFISRTVYTSFIWTCLYIIISPHSPDSFRISGILLVNWLKLCHKHAQQFHWRFLKAIQTLVSFNLNHLFSDLRTLLYLWVWWEISAQCLHSTFIVSRLKISMTGTGSSRELWV